ncbi:MAG: hypothetical protein ACFE9Q_04940 [Candidatus Hodarchaeota archaeon]
MIYKRNTKAKELTIIYGIGFLTLILSAIFFAIRGYPLVNTATETLNISTPPLYMISIFLPYGILIGEVIWLWIKRKEGISYFLLLIETAIVGIFSFIRYIINIPFSGHAIIIFFYLLHQIINRKYKSSIRILIGVLVLIIIIIYKIFLWNDPITFLLGTILGIILWVPGFLYRRRKNKITLS